MGETGDGHKKINLGRNGFSAEHLSAGPAELSRRKSLSTAVYGTCRPSQEQRHLGQPMQN